MNIMNNSDSMKGLQEIVHIIPLGHEIDRAVQPFEKYKADRVYILAVMHNSALDKLMLEKQRDYVKKVKTRLESKSIEVISINVDMFDLKEVMKNVSSIILNEKKKNNIININMSACGRLTSVGVTLAAMVHQVNVYYVHADHYSSSEEDIQEHGISMCDNLKITSIHNFQIMMPDDVSKMLLSRLSVKPEGMDNDEIFRLLKVKEIQGFEELPDDMDRYERRSKKRNLIMLLNKRYLDKLEDLGYIQREKVGRKTITIITEAGQYIAHVSGFME
jgi:transcription elongation factor Elf1